jgi:hypothetical protein
MAVRVVTQTYANASHYCMDATTRTAQSRTGGEVKIKLRPFMTPNFVLQELSPGSRSEGYQQGPSYPLSDVPAEDLAAMCDEFRAEIFRKAGKTDPTPPAQ